MAGTFCPMPRTVSETSNSSAHFGCHERILARTSIALLMDEAFIFLNLALIKSHVLKDPPRGERRLRKNLFSHVNFVFS